MQPRDAADVAEAVAQADARGAPLVARGTGTKSALYGPEAADALDLRALTGIVAHEPDELVVTAEAATPLAEIEAALARSGQALAFEPPRLGALIDPGAPDAGGTIGGVLAVNAAGPRRFQLGAPRDHLLGFEGVTGRGERFVAGGRVVKNVTGYDLSKLVCGSHGTLVVLTRVHLRAWPAPEASASVALRGLDPTAALAALAEVVGSPHDPSGAAHEDPVTVARLEGPAASVAHRADAIARAWRARGPVEVWDGPASEAWWAALRDARGVAAGSAVVWRVSVPPTDAGALLAAVRPDRSALDHGGGLVWLGYAGETPDVRAGMRRGHATLLRAPDAVKAALGVFHPRSPGVAALERRVKATFDPRDVLGRGRWGAP